MRAAAVMCALVTGAHMFAWSMAETKVSAPGYLGQLASVSYTPFDGSAVPGSGK